MIYFLDFEASSLTRHSVPIEIAWVDESGEGESHLIRPAPEWTDWSLASESIHGISREMIAREGREIGWVASRVADVLRGASAVCCDSPKLDQRWLDMLLAAAGQSSSPVPLRHAVEAYAAACAPIVAASPPADAIRQVRDTIADVQRTEEGRARRRHRALDDAQGLWWVWWEIRQRVVQSQG